MSELKNLSLNLTDLLFKEFIDLNRYLIDPVKSVFKLLVVASKKTIRNKRDIRWWKSKYLGQNLLYNPR